MILLKSTLRNHVGRFHLDELFVLGSLKKLLANPAVVVENRAAKSEQAIYEIPVGGHPYLQVNIKYRGWLKGCLIVTLYGVDAIPQGKQLWKQKSEANTSPQQT